MYHRMLFWAKKLPVALLLLLTNLQAQPLLIDDVVQVEELSCYPVYGEKNHYRYLPSEGGLSKNRLGLPEFSLLRFSLEKDTPSDDVNTIVKADGGSKLHFLSTFSTSQAKISRAQTRLQELLDNDSVRIEGPVVFEKGRFYLISSIIAGEDKGKDQLVAAGSAPVTENSKIARAFSLDQQKTALLFESLQLPTTDLSMTYELTYSGLSEYYEAEIEVDWNMIHQSEWIEGGVGVYCIGADIEKGFDKLIKNKAIRFTEVGSNTSMEALTQAIYEKIIEIMFEPVETSNLSNEAKNKVENNIAKSIGNQIKSVFPVRLGVAYKRKNIQRADTIRLSFKGRSSVKRTHYITFNIGEQLDSFLNDTRIFPSPIPGSEKGLRLVNVSLDKETENEFERMINSVSLTLKKQHEDGRITLKELLINKEILRDSGKQLNLGYLRLGDKDIERWQDYEYQVHWSFVGGGAYTTDWKKSSRPSIDLYAPFRRKTIDIIGNYDALKVKGVRAIGLLIKYPFFDLQNGKEIQLNLIPNRSDNPSQVELTLPENSNEIEYEIKYYGGNFHPVKEKGDMSFILLDLLE